MPETFLQFGAGNFLRAFADLFISEANRNGQNAGRVVVVQSTGRERADALNRAQGRYAVAIRGFSSGSVVDRVEHSDCISRAIYAGSDWPAVLKVAESPDLRWIVSNTTEVGYALDERDAHPAIAAAPHSFPAKLLAVLLARHRSGLGGLGIIPCELIEQNASKLRSLVEKQAERWSVDSATLAWIRDECLWIENLVDRIVPGPPESHPLLSQDPLLLSAEPYGLWALAAPESFIRHPLVVRTADVSPYYLRKVRILNGAHTALVAKARPLGLTTVGECLEHPEVSRWIIRVLHEEIVPVLEGRTTAPGEFADAVLDRFRNPFLKHKLETIAQNHETKVRVRLLPTLEEHQRLFGRPALLLAETLGIS